MTMATAAGPVFAGPLYIQVAAILRDKICSSEWTARSALPNEVALARDIGVSIGTVRKALELLESENLIQRRQGRGTFVVETSDETEIERFSNVFLGSKKLHTGCVSWSCDPGKATAEESQILRLAAEASVLRLSSAWTSAEAATFVEQIAISEARFPGLQSHLAESGQFVFPIYRRYYQEAVSTVVETLSCANADAATATALKIPEHTAVLKISRVAYTQSGRPIEWSRRTTYLGQARYVVTMS